MMYCQIQYKLTSPLRHKSLQQESRKVWEGIELAIESDILIPKLDTVFYVRIFVIT